MERYIWTMMATLWESQREGIRRGGWDGRFEVAHVVGAGTERLEGLFDFTSMCKRGTCDDTDGALGPGIDVGRIGRLEFETKVAELFEGGFFLLGVCGGDVFGERGDGFEG
jgi:hypothetical protein